MKHRRVLSLITIASVLIVSALALALPRAGHARGKVRPTSAVNLQAFSPRYSQHNLISDVPGMADKTDANLVNAWGLAASSTGPWWVANNGTSTSTLYKGDGTILPLVVTIPPAPGSDEGGAPTGLVFNGTQDFVVTQNGHSGPSLFIFAGEHGVISGWNPNVDSTHAILAADRSGSDALYKGLALGSNFFGNFLFATNFRSGRIDVFNRNFKFIGSFTDPFIPAGFAPFGIRNFFGLLVVTYAKQKGPDEDDDEAGPGNGFIDIFDTFGFFRGRFASHGPLNSPWGLALAPGGFGRFSFALLVGNFGDGRINAYSPFNGRFLGQLQDTQGKPLEIEGLWALSFGNGGDAGERDELYFTAGPQDESHGLFGRLHSLADTDDGEH